jgi:hypothetical protein
VFSFLYRALVGVLGGEGAFPLFSRAYGLADGNIFPVEHCRTNIWITTPAKLFREDLNSAMIPIMSDGCVPTSTIILFFSCFSSIPRALLSDESVAVPPSVGPLLFRCGGYLLRPVLAYIDPDSWRKEL